MPFDNSTDLKPSLVFLSHVLRHPEQWPPGFQWNYNNCETCAIGLACLLWPNSIKLPEHNNYDPWAPSGYFDLISDQLADRFIMPKDIAEEIFMDLWELQEAPITPNHVADAIDAYLVRHP